VRLRDGLVVDDRRRVPLEAPPPQLDGRSAVALGDGAA